MKHGRRLLYVLILCILTGCAGQRWVHPTATAQQTAGDRAYCLAQARQAVDPRRDLFRLAYDEVYGLCMQGRGWTLEQAHK